MILSPSPAPFLDRSSAVYRADGNSQTEGQGGHSYPASLATLLGKAVTNYGVGGQNTTQMLSDAVSQVFNNFAAGVPNILCVGEVRNQISNNADTTITARQAVDLLWQYCDLARSTAAGAGKELYIVVWNILPTVFTTWPLGLVELNRRFDAANILLAAEWRAHANSFVNVRSEPALAVSSLANTYWIDGVHLTAVGDALVARMFYQAILNLRTS